MSGTVIGGKKAAKTNKKRYGKDFYVVNGRKGGQNGTTGGFYANPELAKIAGAKGGSKSRRNEAERWWKENKRTIKKLRKNGCGWAEIASYAGVSYGNLMYKVNKFGEGLK